MKYDIMLLKKDQKRLQGKLIFIEYDFPFIKPLQPLFVFVLNIVLRHHGNHGAFIECMNRICSMISLF